MTNFVTKSGLECLEIVLKKCIAENDDWIKKLTTIFERCKIIKSDTAKEVCRQLGQTEHNRDDIIDIITKSIETGEVKRKRFEEAGKAKDFPGGSLVSNAVEYFGSAAFISDWMRWLVTSWENIERPEVQELVIADWPKCEWDKELWVLQFIMKCAKDKQLDKVKLMTEKIKSLLQELQGNQMSMNPDQDDDLSSFVNIEESEVQESWKNVEQATAQALAENETHLEVIESILKEYFIMESEYVMKLFSLFKDIGLITAENSSLAMKNTEEQRFFASHLMEMIMADSSFLWKDKMIVACECGEFPGDKAFASIIKTLLKRKVIRDEIRWFISAWNQVKKSTILIEGIIADTWKEEFKNLTDYTSWPLYLYEICVLSEDEEVVKEFIGKVSDVLQKDSTSTEHIRRDSEDDVIMHDVSFQSPDFFSSAEDEEENSQLREQQEMEKEEAGQEEETGTTDDEEQQCKAEMSKSDFQKVELHHDEADDIQVCSIDDKNAENVQALVEEASTGEGDSVTSLEENKDWINVSTELLESCYSKIKPIVESTWSSDDELVDQEQWPSLLLCKCENEEDASTLDSFVRSVKNALKPDESEVKLKEEYDESKKWLNKSLHLLNTNRDSLQPLAASYWPELANPKSRWPTSLINESKKETDLSKVVEFVMKMKTMLAEKEYKENKKWLNKSANIPKFQHSNIKLVVGSIWPDNPELTKKRWPMYFINECNSGKDIEKVNEFVRIAKGIMEAETAKAATIDTKSDFERELAKISDVEEPQEQTEPAKQYVPVKRARTNIAKPKVTTEEEENPDMKSGEFPGKSPDDNRKNDSSITSSHENIPVIPPRTHHSEMHSYGETKIGTSIPPDKETTNIPPKLPLQKKPEVRSSSSLTRNHPVTKKQGLQMQDVDVGKTLLGEKTFKPVVPAKPATWHKKLKKTISSVPYPTNKDFKNQKEMNANKEWIRSSNQTILASANIALSIAYTIWPKYTSINDVNEMLDKILEETTPAKLNQFVSDFKAKVKQEQAGAVSERTRSHTKQPEDLQESKDWIGKAKNSLELFRNSLAPLASKTWPDDKSIMKNWPNNFISHTMKETDVTKLEGFVQEAKAILKEVMQKEQKSQNGNANKNKKNRSSNVDAGHIEEDVDLKNGIEWMQSEGTRDFKKFEVHLTEVVYQTWPDRSDIVKDELWPMKLVEAVKESKQKDKVKELIRKMKNIVEMIKKQTDVEPEIRGDNELGKRVIEFRVVLSRYSLYHQYHAPKNFVVISDLWNWEFIRMHWSESHQCFHLKYYVKSIPHSFQYKYWNNGEWEMLSDHYGNDNRLFYGPTAYHGKIILFDVAKFSHQTLDIERMSLHLPLLHDLIEKKADLSQMIDEIHTWVLQMKTGWISSYRSFYKPEKTKMEIAINNWVVRELMPAWNQSEYIPIICCLALCNALADQNHLVDDKSLLINLLTVLSTERLNEDDCKAMYGELLSQFLNNDLRSKLPSIPETVLGLLLSVEANPVPEFLFSLPLYWLAVNGGELAECMPRGDTNNFRLSRSCLPLIHKVNWEKIQNGLSEYYQQRDLLNLMSRILQIARLNPWIIKAFEYMLKYDSIMSFITQKSEILFRFDLETIVRCIDVRLKVAFWKVKEFIEAEAFVELLFDEVVRRVGLPDAKKSMNVTDVEYLLKCIGSILNRTNLETPTMDDNQVVLCCLKMANKVVNLSNAMEKSEMNSNFDKTIFESILRVVLKGLENTPVTAPQIQHWNKLMNLEWTDPQVLQSWQSKLCDRVELVINRTWSRQDKQFLEFYTQSLIGQQFHDNVESLLQKRAEKAFENLLLDESETSNYSILHWFGRSDTQQRMTKIYDSFISKQIAKYHPLEFMVKWPHLIPFFKQHYGNNFKGFSSKTVAVITNHVGTFNGVMRNLVSGNVRVNELDIIKSRSQRCQEICKYTAKELQKKHDLVELIRFRSKELDAFYRAKESLSVFLQCCKQLEEERIAVDTEELDDVYAEDIKYTQLSKLVNCRRTDCDRTAINVIFYDSVIQKLTEIMRIGILENNSFFYHCWNGIAKEKRVDWVNEIGETDEGFVVITWKNVLQELWVPVTKNLLSITGDLDEGTFRISDIFEKLADYSEPERAKQITQLYDFYYDHTKQRLANCQERIVDAQNWMKVRNSHAVNDVLLDMVQVLNLKGNFQHLEIYSSKAQQDISILDFAKMHQPENIAEFDSKSVQILKSFVDKRELITWLREKTKEVKDIQALCDLAMINAGDTPVEVDRVSTLLSAVMGFSSLLFGVENIKDINTLNKRCKEVISNCNKDPKLQSKWTSIGFEVDWIKQIETFYGSDQMHAMGEAQMINKNGVYTIACKDKNNPELDDCIELKLRKLRRQGSVSGETQPRALPDQKIYKLADLHNLQSKLMLIAGEREDGNHVTTYVNLLTAVESLTQVFVQLVSAGCMLFENWKMEIASNVDSDFTISVKFDEEAPPISGTGKMETIDSITTVMNTIFSRWIQLMNKYRLCHYYLNEFNVQQITYLCKELADIHIASVPDQVYMLLARVKKNTTLVEITQALNEATISTDDDDDDTSIEENRENLGDESREEQRIEKMKRMVRTLVREDDVPEDIAKAAVMERGFEDKDDCSDWILLSYGEIDKINELAEKFNEEIGFAHEEGIVGAVATVLHDRSTRSLREVMIRLQQEASIGSQAISASLLTVYEKYNMDTAALTLRDFLSVKHLGKFLTILGQPKRDLNQSGNVDQPRSSPQREMKPPLQSGKPNLIICQERDLLMQVLSLYMHSKDQPLPTTSEVLICSEKTNADEVERFFRRAMCNCDNDRNPLFCLAMAHKLSHNVSEAAERIFTALSQSDINREFKLVIFTSKQQHYLTTCFDQYHVDMRYQVKEAEATEYLAKHLKVNMNVWKKSAACVEANYQLVKVVYSYRSGVGKTLHVKRLKKDLQSKMESHNNGSWHTTTIRFMEKTLNTNHVIDMLNSTDEDALNADTHLIHLDFTPAVREGVEEFAFNLLILGSIEDSQGRIWQRHQNHMYAVEITEFMQGKLNRSWNQHILEYLPKIRCLSPKEVVENGNFDNCLPMDQIELELDTIQRPFQYLLRHYKKEDLDDFKYNNEEPNQNQKQCINIFLEYCSIKNPSWAQLHHFASFLNIQLANCEKSIFCNKEIVGELIGLKSFAVSFMIKMAQDFATPSLSSADESMQDVSEEEKAFDQHQLRRKWEESSHPYIFFNDDGISMTFINVNITNEGHLVDRNKEVITHNAISQQLLVNLIAQRVPLGVDFDSLNRPQKLMEICKVMGIKYTQEEVPDPDPTYELTTDNVLKILAIYMRFKCQIPVIIMGETGCGKTRMVEFISRLKVQNSASGVGAGKVKNMITLKVHGGVTVKDVHQSIEKAKEIAQDNVQEYGLNTILFFDEANTTESIYAIKEVVCDLEVNGKSFRDSELQIVAACNPYKKLSKEAVKKLENSGLGYRVKKEDTKDKLGSIPMRTLVYRVVALPPSMQPFVWDFGQLADDTEKIYIGQMIKKKLGLTSGNRELLSDMLSDVQCYMRKQKDESRYVSLRDVERCMIAFEWFWKNKSWLYRKVKDEHKPNTRCYQMDEEIRTLIQVLGVCYHASLDDRKKFRKEVSERLNIRSARQHRYEQHEIGKEIVACQRALVKDMKIEKDIALNEALVENVFMIAICADMKIPLFLVGKPGSSKSLAKTIVSDNMRGPNSTSKMFKHLKQVQVVSFQCSALTHASGIESVFNQCVRLQENQDVTKYSAVVVLDEIGLAEDSPNMPLKVLHPLLESGSTKSESLINTDPNQKVAFVGISNWSLDPAKMNRGLFVTRKKPSEKDLRITTQGIFSDRKESKTALRTYNEVIKALRSTYLKIYEREEREYFGLRDFYSLMKMVRPHCMGDLTMQDVMTAVQRNFSGGKVSHIKIFEAALESKFVVGYSLSSVQDIIEDNLRVENESRYLLLLTNQYSAINLLHLMRKGKNENVQVIFGSSFPGDKNYTEICRNINRIKICMEAGSPVVILNLTEIHESLYDALNQHYVTFGDQKYVDLGLGGHRVKSRVHDNFKMIIVEKKEIVYEEYPIPLINRLEKHHFDSKSLLMHKQKASAKDVERWIDGFTSYDKEKFEKNEAFLGFHDDTVSSIILVCDEKRENCEVEHYQQALLQSATMDAIFRLPKSKMEFDVKILQEIYLNRQSHDSLIQLLKNAQMLNQESIPIYEVTTYSNILSEKDRREVEKQLCFNKNSVMLLSLQQFETEQQFLRKLDDFFKKCQKVPADSAVLLIQCFQAHLYRQLISCARYALTNKLTQFTDKKANEEQKVTVAFLLSTDRQSKNDGNEPLVLQPTTDGEIVYIDELRPTMKLIGPASCFFDLTLQEVFKKSLDYLTASTSADEFLDIVSLLKDCVCEAIDKLQLETGERNLERIAILNRLFDRKENEFSAAVVKKITEILSQREEALQPVNHKLWMIEEAFSRKHLLEGGTFRKTIWLCLKHHTAQYLAYITSIIDSNNNLNVYSKSKREAWERKMWLAVFEKYSIPWDPQCEKEFKVAYSLPQGSYQFQVPFMSMIFKELQDKWKASCEEIHEKKVTAVFLNTVRIWPLYSLIKEALNTGGEQMKDAFISDLVRMVYCSGADPKTENEVQAIDKIVNYFVKSKCLDAKDEEYYQDGDELAVVFLNVIGLQIFLKTLSDIFKTCPELIKNTDKWISFEEHPAYFEIHEHAFTDMMALIRGRSVEIKDADICREWIELARKAKKVFRDHNKRISDGNKKKIIENWKPISFLYYFLTQILPSMSDEKLQKKYTQVIAKQANLLSKGCKQRDLQSKEYLRLLSSTIGKCYEEIELKLLVSWQDSECKICRRRMQSPRRLPCGHFLCVNCARTTSAAESSTCPTCANRIPKDYVLEEVSLSVESAEQLNDFKSNCTSFFLRYLTKFTFEKENISEKEVPALLVKELLLTSDGKQELKTFALDININFQSFILGQILQNATVIEDILAALSNKDFGITMAALKYFEWERLDTDDQAETELVSRDWKDDEMQFSFNKLCEFKELNLGLLETIARIRLGIKAMSCYIQDSMLENDDDVVRDEMLGKIQSIIRFLDKNNTLKLYFIKCGCAQFGTEWFEKLRKTDFGAQLIPAYLAKEANSLGPNYWMLTGRNFAAEKSRLHSLLPAMKMKLEELKEVFSCLNEYDEVEELVGALVTISWFMEQNDLETAVSCLKEVSKSENSLPDLLASASELVSALESLEKRDRKIVVELLTMVSIVISKQSYLVKDFLDILKNPESLQSKFLPAMPESLYFTLPKELRTERLTVQNQLWTEIYTCPNGHIYTIANCTKPVIESKCNVCGAVIGGINYKPAEGNKRFALEEKTQAGYMLEKVDPPRQNMDKPEDRMSKQGVAVTQAILHSTMILALCKNLELTSSFSKIPEMDVLSFIEYLIDSLLKNLRDLSTAFAKNMDDTLIIMHKILLNILRTEGPENNFPKEKYDWSSVDSRKQWEQLFRHHYLVPVFQHIDEEIADGLKLFSEAAEEFCKNSLYRVTHDLPLENLQQKDAVWNNQDLWKTIVHPTSAHLLQTIQDKPNEQSAIIQLVLSSPNLSLLHFLVPVLQLQKHLIEKNQYKLDMDEADKITFQQYLDKSLEDKHKLRKQFEKYVEAWSLVYPLLKVKLQNHPDFEFCVNMNSSISVIMPSKRGRGCYAKMFVEQLIDIQNEFLGKCAEKIPDLSLGEVAVSDIHSSHVAQIDKQKDLLPLIRMHTNYHIVCDETGTQHQISYNISALEKRVREKFILYKKLIKKMTIPCIQYPQDIGIGTDWEKVRNLIKQVPLDQKLVMSIDTAVHGVKPADFYEGVRTLTHAISFLSKVQTDDERRLSDYMVKDLMLSAGRISVIPKNAQVKHTLALYQRLSWHKAKQFVTQGLNPYQEYLPKDQQVPVPENLADGLQKAFAEIKVSLLQQRLNEILIKKPDYSGDWSLVEDIFPYIEDYIDHNPEDDSWYKRLPEELCFKHIVHLFQLSVEYERDNK